MATGPYAGPLERIDETCVRIPKGYKAGMLVDGLIFADDRLLEQLRRTRRRTKWPTSHFCPASSTPAWRCRTSTGATGFASAASRPPTRRKEASFRRAESVTTSTAASDWCARNLSLEALSRTFAAGRDALPQRADRRGRSGKYHFDAKEMQRLMGEGAQLCSRPGAWRAERH